MQYYKARKARRYKSPNFREIHLHAVTVDGDGRVHLFGHEASPVVVDYRFHFFEEVLDHATWERVRAFYQLPKRKRHSNYSHGVRRGEGKLVGLEPKRPINVIQEERGKEAGEKSWRMAEEMRKIKKALAEADHIDDPQIDPFPELADEEIPF